VQILSLQLPVFRLGQDSCSRMRWTKEPFSRAKADSFEAEKGSQENPSVKLHNKAQTLKTGGSPYSRKYSVQKLPS